MLRQPGSKYVRSRSSTLLKVKSFSDEEAIIIGTLLVHARVLTAMVQATNQAKASTKAWLAR